MVVAGAVAAPVFERDRGLVAENPVSSAPDGVSAAATAARQGRRVEALDERSETRTVYANPDGLRTAVLTATPTRVRRGSTWVPIDTTVRPRADGMVAPSATVGDVAFSGGGSAPLVRMVKDGRLFELSWPRPLPKPKLAGDTVTYRDVMSDVDLVMKADRHGYQQHLVVGRRGAGPRSVRLGVRADGLRLTVDEAGGLRAVDRKGTEVLTAPPSTMWDAAGRTAAVAVSVVDGELTVTPDAAFLADPAVRYPVTIDPPMRTFERWGWANVVSGKAGESYWNQSAALDPNLAQVGQCYNADGRCAGIAEAWAYFQYDTSFLNGSDILDVTFRSAVGYSPNCDGAARGHGVFMPARLIDAGLNWNNKPEGPKVGGWAAPQSNADHGCGGIRGAGTAVPNGNVNPVGSSVYYLRADNGGDTMSWRKYLASETKLTVTYNHRPDAPSDLRTDPPTQQPCAWCAGKPYLSAQNVRLIGRFTDPDNDGVEPHWRWRYGTGATNTRVGAVQASGATHDLQISPPENVDVSWWAHGFDPGPPAGHFAGLESHGRTFVVDRTRPTTPPGVSSTAYPDDEWQHGGAGVPGVFTFSSGGVADIDHYLYGFEDPPTSKVAATALGGPATVTVTPPGDGRRVLYVQSVDRAGNRSGTRDHTFFVRAGDGAYAQYAFEGNSRDDAYLGDRHGTLRGAAAYAPGAVGTSLLLDGRAGSEMVAPNTVRTDSSFSVSAWVRPDSLPTRPMGVATQDSGAGYGGWLLHYRNDDGNTPRWHVWVFGGDPANPGSVAVFSPTAHPQVGRWTHLTAVYDQARNTVALYVNGVLAAERTTPAGWVPLRSEGQLAVGRLQYAGQPGHVWHGGIDEVRIYDRALAAAEVTAMVSRDNVRSAHWRFDDQPGTTARNEVVGGADGVLTGGAELVDNGGLGGAVHLDGQDDTVVTGAPAVRTDQSYSVAAWVKADRFTTGRSMTAVSQDGTANSGFYLQYDLTQKKWAFVRLPASQTDPTGYVVAAPRTPVPGTWVHLTGVFDAPSRTMSFYVDGEPAGVLRTGEAAPWSAEGPLVVGRGMYRGQQVDHWPGSVDEVQTYTRALAPEEIRSIVTRSDVTAGAWRLDGDADDTSGRGLTGSWTGTPGWTEGQGDHPDPADQAAVFTGANSVSAPNAVNTADSFSVSAWVRPDRAGCTCTILSQDAVNNSAFALSTQDDGRYGLLAVTEDPAGRAPGNDLAVAGAVQPGQWTHVAGVFNRQRGRIELYLNGALVATAPHTATVSGAGRVQLGRARWQGGYVNAFTGAIDDVVVHSRALYVEEIRAMAGRDPLLIHHWRLNETGGDTGADAVGVRPVRLTGGTRFGPGRSGNAAEFDGADDAASVPAVDLRTDQDFTVSAFVRLDDLPECPATCRRDAVSLEGGQNGKLRLGHVIDDDQAHAPGKWVFEMPEQATGRVTEAAISVRPSQAHSWVLLVGVYRASTGTIALHVYGPDTVDFDTGTLGTPWHSAGPAHVGRGVQNGAPGRHWQGKVDDVRLYGAALPPERLAAIFRSYPAP
ncbi:hypothetical protein BU204_24045 [Actinophytocola xanthii]|uniref:LamG-like jellyroll fold domain-containing protein n=1 Tax=Actinophytocola xanthii TaxID=1912961 RepID=A0A1Q8CKV5_9PSEU|nr:hypothetical protein BU204_24045 [Actinophytocola xanthii]